MGPRASLPDEAASFPLQGTAQGATGIFPGSFVKILKDFPEEDDTTNWLRCYYYEDTIKTIKLVSLLGEQNTRLPCPPLSPHSLPVNALVLCPHPASTHLVAVAPIASQTHPSSITSYSKSLFLAPKHAPCHTHPDASSSILLSTLGTSQWRKTSTAPPCSKTC